MRPYLHLVPIFSKYPLEPEKVCWTPHHTYQLMTAFESDFSTTGGFIFMLLARFLGIFFKISHLFSKIPINLGYF